VANDTARRWKHQRVEGGDKRERDGKEEDRNMMKKEKQVVVKESSRGRKGEKKTYRKDGRRLPPVQWKFPEACWWGR